MASNLTAERQALLDLLLAQEGLETDCIPRRGHQRECVLSFAQQRLWFLNQLAPGNPFYNINHALRLEFALDPALLQRCLNEIVQRHEVLRTTFVAREGKPVQVVAPRLHIDLALLDLSAFSASACQAEVERLATDEARVPFDLERGPLLRTTALRLGVRSWVLLLTIHHIVSDAWSTGVFFDELQRLYQAFSAGKNSPLEELTIQYADFSEWQQRSLSKCALQPHLDYWRTTLEGAKTLDFPADRPRRPVQHFSGAAYDFTLAPLLTAALRDLGQRESCTLFMTLLAAFQVLLSRYSGQEDIVVGVPIAGRTRTDVERLIGFFVNTLVMRTTLDHGASFNMTLSKVREVALGAYAHQDVPFERLVEELQPERDLSRTPLCQVAFQLFSTQNASPRNSEPGGSGVLKVERGTANFDLICTLTEQGGELLGRIEYNTDLYDRATIGRLVENYRCLLNSTVRDPSTPIIELELLHAAEQQRVVSEWNDSAKTYADEPITARLQAQAANAPHAIAVVTRAGSLSYAELNRRANQLAHCLRQLGVERGKLVGLCLERSHALVFGLLAIVKAGGVYVPLDAEYPPERLAFIARDAGLSVLITRAELREMLSMIEGASVVCVDDQAEQIAGFPDTDLGINLAPDDLAYVIYTSGSTGRPKGALNTQLGLQNRLAWMQDAFGLGPSDRVLHKTPIGFDVSVWELLWPLLNGATMIMADPGEHRDPHALLEWIARERVTIVHFIPALLDRFLEEPGVERCLDLRRVICSGEVLSSALEARFFERLQAELYNLYGPTEAAIDVTWWKCERGNARARVPLGRPIANVRIYVLDDRQQPVPIGVSGELCIAGAAVGYGYLGRPELTAERFIADPFVPETAAGSRLYRTGDQARWTPEGILEFLGRRDQQLKLHGVRVELGEVESALQQLPGVREAVVVPKPDLSGELRLVAYVVPLAGAELTLIALRRALARQLPEVMIPSALVVLSEFQLTPNGKVDREALPTPSSLRPTLERELVPPRNDRERELARIWSELIGVSAIGVHDNFFELGGHSLLATQVASRIRLLFGIELPLRSLFESPTVSELATELALLDGVAGCSDETAPAIKPLSSGDLAAQVAQLSDEEIEASLRVLLKQEQQVAR